ncbi:MAG: hypothetical protein CBB71_05000 [Rhodopirellula sp. TMED11]|nr:MAG: hypothetical protein CBB71_05000 [Rhodopirellula sp. TMED11]
MPKGHEPVFLFEGVAFAAAGFASIAEWMAGRSQSVAPICQKCIAIGGRCREADPQRICSGDAIFPRHRDGGLLGCADWPSNTEFAVEFSAFQASVGATSRRFSPSNPSDAGDGLSDHVERTQTGPDS